MNSFYSEIELQQLGFKSYGKNVLVSRFANIYNPSLLTLGNEVRIDDFCILSGTIEIGDRVHISAYCALYGSKGIVFADDSGISAKSIIYSAVDDFSGDYLIGPMQNVEKTNVVGGTVYIDKYAQIGAGSIIFPNCRISEGSIVGAMSLVKSSTIPWTINAGIPSKMIKERSRKLLNLL